MCIAKPIGEGIGRKVLVPYPAVRECVFIQQIKIIFIEASWSPKVGRLNAVCVRCGILQTYSPSGGVILTHGLSAFATLVLSKVLYFPIIHV
jgi:hypothetical protein